MAAKQEVYTQFPDHFCLQYEWAGKRAKNVLEELEMISEARMWIGSCVRRFRTKLELSQEDAAGLCDLDVRIFGKVERGVENYEMATLEKVLTGLGMTLEDFKRI